MVGVALGPAPDAHHNNGLRLSPAPSYIRGPSILQLPLLTFGFLGTQIVWSVEMAYGTPYLLELGLSKATMAMVFMAGPIAGLLVQPIIGVMADQSTHRWGRRRPYLLAASFVCSLFVLLLGFARVPAALFGIEGATPILTVLGIWGLDFAVNAVMALDRSLILDMLPADKQAAGNAWVARICSVGSILGFYVGDLDLPNTFPFSWLGFAISSGSKAPSEPQVRCLSLLTAFFMMATHLVVMWAAIERRLEHIGDSPLSRRKPLQILGQSFIEFARVARQLSEPIKAVLKVQIFSWICWFPLMFYSTEWVSQTAVASFLKNEENLKDVDYEALRAKGTRAGSHAMFLQALLSFAASILLPFILPPAEKASADSAEHMVVSGGVSTLPAHTNTLMQRKIWLAPSWLPAVLQDVLEDVHGRVTNSSTGKPSPVGRKFKGVKLTTIWTISHFLLACTTWFTWPIFSSQSLSGATLLITLMGFCWAVTGWVPFALIGIFIQSDEAAVTSNVTSAHAYESIPMREDVDGGEEQPREEGDELYFDPSNNDTPTAAVPSAQATQAGSVLGLHNIAIVIPQLIVSIAASILFALFEPKKVVAPTVASTTVPAAAVASSVATISPPSVDSDVSQSDAVNVVFVVGGIFSFAAGLLTIRLSKRFDRVVAVAGPSGDAHS